MQTVICCVHSSHDHRTVTDFGCPTHGRPANVHHKCCLSNIVAFLLISFSALLSRASDRPNIVLILSDDQAWTDYGFMGHPDIRTPHLDRLAQRSLLFERGYVAAPLCRPSLATLVTGLYPSQHGITGNDVNGHKNRAARDIPLREAFHQHTSIIRLLTENGYLTHQSGKWWEGSWQDGGFTHGMTHGDPERGGRHGDAGLKIGREGMEPVTRFIDDAVEQDKPFFLWYAPFLPHTPHNPPKRLMTRFKPPSPAVDVARYYAMCEWFDETCGQLLNHIDSKGVSDNTVVIYLCDNGWAAKSTNADDPNQKLWNGFALRSKCSPFENGIRTPIMVSWPGHIEPCRSPEFAHSTDFFPTVAAAAGIDTPEHLTGINLLDPAARNARKRVFGVTHATHNITLNDPDDTLQYLWCVEDRWKLIVRRHGSDTTRYRALHTWDTAPVRLYDIKNDPHEKTDIADKHPDVVARMKRQIKAWKDSLSPSSATTDE